MSEDEAIKVLETALKKGKEIFEEYGVFSHIGRDEQQAIETILDLYKELQNENARLKYLLRESSKIIDEYTNELENDTKKIIEYREKYLEKGDKNE